MVSKQNQKVSKTNKIHSHHCHLRIGCWNMRSLVEAEGPVETSVVRPSTRGVAVDRKVSFLVRELKKYDVQVTGISETKWFGQAVYEVEGYTILHSGRPVPTEAPMARNEGVAVVLDPALTAAWKEAGGVWEAVSSRIVSARLKISVKKSIRSQKSRDQCPSFIPYCCECLCTNFQVFG